MARAPTVGGSVQATAFATTGAMSAIIPIFVLSASWTFVRQEFGLDEAALGLVVSAFFAASTLMSVAGGRFADRVGPATALRLSALVSALTMALIATTASGLAHLILLMVVIGAMNGVAWPASDLALARAVTQRKALTFGIKQSAVPLSTLLAGASLPIVAVAVGWRWSFVLGALLTALVAAMIPRRMGTSPPGAEGRTSGRGSRTSRRLLSALALALGAGTAASLSLASFFVEAAVAAGLSLARAGWLLGAASIGGILIRLIVGSVADQLTARRQRQLQAVPIASGLLLLGTVGYAMLASGRPSLLPTGAMLAYSFGYGWTGLLLYSVVTLNPNAPAAATGIVLTGGSAGSAVGPFLFGLMATHWSYEAAWFAAAIAAGTSALILLIGHQQLRHNR